MKNFNRIMVGIVLVLAAIFIGVNLSLTILFGKESGRTYRVEINRLQNEIAENGIDSIDIKQYNCIKKIAILNSTSEESAFFEGDGSDYTIKNIDGVYYRFDYEILLTEEYKAIYWAVNAAMGIMALAVLMVLNFIRLKLLKPFHMIKDVPYELSKGNLTVGLKENKNRFFGRFVWGLDLLRENLEKQKAKELYLQKEKKTLVLSISHDIKTPLSAINLYAKALSRNLYNSDEKRMEIAESISAKVNEIEGFVSEIIKASSEDFLGLEVNNSEFYLGDLLERINTYYHEKLSLLKIEYDIKPYSNCLIKGDMDRAIEVLQNILENAIKYGDGRNITISVSNEEDCRLITVANSGSTLSENELPHIFESFWRGSNVGNNSGSGLGLYICRQLLKKMDGDIFANCNEDELRVTVVLRMI
ncbi:MAG: HAMP domain-containing sensor histidine kinase [Herbinix sp.]|nr:HAMP domain-containing sensor histidine kinase [Herbinix sp.]